MDSNHLSIMNIAYSTSADGVGLRNSLYLAGCPLRCPGCHNQQAWDINNGSLYSVEEVCDKLNIDKFNISILGGEPLMQYDAVVNLCRMIKDRYPNKTIWMWSGYTYTYIQEHYPNILQYIDVLVDGPFIQSKTDPTLQWRGSSNQNVIYIK